MSDKGQKIIRLEAENVKRLQAVEIKPDGNVIVVGGQNAQGKTSVLDAIQMALGGASSIPAEPIKRGAKKAHVVVETETLTVTRKFTPKGSTLKVESKDGAVFGSPQKMLDSLIGDISFDPLEFDRMKPADQLERLKSLVGLDFEDDDRRRQEAFDERTTAKREAKRVTALIDAMPKGIGKRQAAAVDVADLVAELSRCQEANRGNEQWRERLQDLRVDAMNTQETIEKMEAELAVHRSDFEKITAQGKEASAKVKTLVDEDIQAIRDRIAGAEGVNETARQHVEWQARSNDLTALAERSEDLTETITEIDEQKRDAIENADMPIPGLGFGDGCVMLNDLPLDQASGAERLKASVALGMALNKEMKVLLVRDGSLLDKESLSTIAMLADFSGCQVWLERVSDGKEVSIVIEDGLVKEQR